MKHHYQTRQASERAQLVQNTSNSRTISVVESIESTSSIGGTETQAGDYDTVLTRTTRRNANCDETRRVTRSQTGHGKGDDHVSGKRAESRGTSSDDEQGLTIDIDMIYEEGGALSHDESHDTTSEEESDSVEIRSPRKRASKTKSQTRKRKGTKRRRTTNHDQNSDDEFDHHESMNNGRNREDKMMTEEQDSNTYPRRRSSRIRSCVHKLPYDDIEDEYIEEDELLIDDEVLTTTTSRTGRIIKPTIRYS